MSTELFSDLTAQNISADTERRATIVNESFALNAIFSPHHSLQDAADILGEVGPDTIVFTEGHMKEPEYASRRLHQHASLARRRLQYGQYSDGFDQERDALIAEFKDRDPARTDVYDTFNLTLYEGLLAKGCIVLPADYLNVYGDAPEIYDFEPRRKVIAEKISSLTRSSLEDLVQTVDVFQDDWLSYNARREKLAVDYVLYFLGEIAAVGREEALSRLTGSDKLTATIIFGLAHRDSLQVRFRQLGIRISAVCINNGEVPTEKILSLADDFALTKEELRAYIRDSYTLILREKLTRELNGYKEQ